MKRALITLIAVLTLLCGTQAQETATKIVVKKVDNTQITLAVDDVDEITFTKEVTLTEEEVSGHEYVDLGLPSGTLWATCNVGASFPEEFGDYFAWGETAPKEFYDWNTYKWCEEGDEYDMTKYCYDSSYGYKGFTDDKTELDLEDDAAYVNWGTGWRIPSIAQTEELRNKCTWTWTTLNGVKGRKVKGPNGNSIFLPAAGFRLLDYLNSIGSMGNYWSSSLYDFVQFKAYELDFNSDGVKSYYTSRYYGQSVRAVLTQEAVTMMVIKKVDNTQLTIAIDDIDEINFTEEEVTSPEYVDLGLPSGTLWATCNVGANSPEEYGDYFAWGETTPKEVYDWGTYKWAEGASDQLTKYCYDSSFGYNGFTDDKTELDLEDDAAYVNKGSDWRMPSLEQIEELKTKCTWTWTTLNGVNGREVTGPNGNSIFLPAAGLREDGILYGDGSLGIYSSRSLRSNYTYNTDEFYFSSDDVDWSESERRYGESVRAVRR